MRVIIDGIVYSSTPTGGVYNYFNELIPRLAKFPNTEIQIFVPKVSTEPPAVSGVTVNRNVLPGGSWFPDGRVKRGLGQVKRWMEAQILKRRFQETQQSVFHTTGFTVSPFNDMPEVFTVYDMISEMRTEDLKLEHIVRMRDDKKRAIERATRLIAISECTKRDLCKVYGIPASRVDTIHFGVNHEFYSHRATASEQKQIRTKYRLDGPYILFVGGRLHHKNFPKFLEAYATSKLSKDFLLGVAGYPWESHETALIKKLGVESRIRWMPYLTDELPAVYQMAEQFVFPSLYEGFGLPLVEAFVAGCPVAAAKAGPFPELAENAACFFNPEDTSDMARAMIELTNPQSAEKYRQLGRERARFFSWDKAAEQTLKTYHRALELSVPETVIQRAGGVS